MKLSGQQCQQRLTAIANVTSWDNKELRRDGQVQNKYYEGRAYAALSCLTLGAVPAIATLARGLSVSCTSVRDVRAGVNNVRQMIETLKAQATTEEAKATLRTLTVKVQAAIAAYVAIENRRRDALGEEAQINVDALLGSEAPANITFTDPAAAQTINETMELLSPAVTPAAGTPAAATPVAAMSPATAISAKPAPLAEGRETEVPHGVDVGATARHQGATPMVASGESSPQETGIPRSGSNFSFDNAAAEQVLSQLLEVHTEGMKLRSGKVVPHNEDIAHRRYHSARV